jgi:NAD(P)-dependent dehydrogenase (short-subunit alcohol dehydrogenase family)
MDVQSLRVDQKIVLLTGGYGYLGTAIAKSMAFHGATVLVAGRSAAKFAEAFTGSINVKFVELDVSDGESIKTSFNQVYKEYSKIDVIINNAFYSKGRSPETMTDEEWSFGVDGVLATVFRSIRAIIPIFKEQGHGRIINVSSMYGVVAPDFGVYEDSPEYLNPPHYGAAKAGIIQLTKYYASYLGDLNILVNSVTPGPFPSETVQRNKTFIAALEKNTLLNRIGKPEDLAGIFTFLSSDASSFITGQNFIVDGGWTTR